MDLEELYNIFNEDTRLNQSKSSSIEFLITTNFIDKYLAPNSKILDIGAGTGVYSIYYAEQGYSVTAVEPVKKNLDCLKSKITNDMDVEAMLGNALDLSAFADNSFDVVLCLGPLYHLKNDEEKIKCIKETHRVCKNGGKILYAYISNDMVALTETMKNDLNFISGSCIDPESFKLNDEPFAFMTVSDMRELADKCDIKVVTEFAADGFAELFADRINEMNQDQFEQWMRFHLYMCEKKEALAYSNHIVLVAEK